MFRLLENNDHYLSSDEAWSRNSYHTRNGLNAQPDMLLFMVDFQFICCSVLRLGFSCVGSFGGMFILLANNDDDLFSYQLGLVLVITRGMDLIFWLISFLSTIGRLSYAFLLLQASNASSAVTFVFWWLVGNVSSSLKGITSVGSVAKLLVDSDSLSDSDLI